MNVKNTHNNIIYYVQYNIMYLLLCTYHYLCTFKIPTDAQREIFYGVNNLMNKIYYIIIYLWA